MSREPFCNIGVVRATVEPGLRAEREVEEVRERGGGWRNVKAFQLGY